VCVGNMCVLVSCVCSSVRSYFLMVFLCVLMVFLCVCLLLLLLCQLFHHALGVERRVGVSTANSEAEKYAFKSGPVYSLQSLPALKKRNIYIMPAKRDPQLNRLKKGRSFSHIHTHAHTHSLTHCTHTHTHTHTHTPAVYSNTTGCRLEKDLVGAPHPQLGLRA